MCVWVGVHFKIFVSFVTIKSNASCTPQHIPLNHSLIQPSTLRIED